MGKIFGLMACLVTVAVVSGCVAPKPGKARKDIRGMNAEVKANIEKIQADTKKLVEDAINKSKEAQSCRKPEAGQKISADAEKNAISTELVADVQDTNVVNAQCKGKDVLNEKVVYAALKTEKITGPLELTGKITSIEIESDRTCAKLESSTVVADVTQSQLPTAVVEADGDVQLTFSTSVWKSGIAMPVAEGKNLLKVKYFNCAESKEVKNEEDGSVTTECVKTTLIGTKELVVNVVVKQNVLEGVRDVKGCFEEADEPAKPKTDGQE